MLINMVQSQTHLHYGIYIIHAFTQQTKIIGVTKATTRIPVCFSSWLSFVLVMWFTLVRWVRDLMAWVKERFNTITKGKNGATISATFLLVCLTPHYYFPQYCRLEKNELQLWSCNHVLHAAYCRATVVCRLFSPWFFCKIIDVNHWVWWAAILASWCEQNWGEFIMPVGRGGGVSTMPSTIPTHRNVLFSTVLPAWRWDQDARLSNSMIDIYDLMEKKGDCEQSK